MTNRIKEASGRFYRTELVNISKSLVGSIDYRCNRLLDFSLQGLHKAWDSDVKMEKWRYIFLLFTLLHLPRTTDLCLYNCCHCGGGCFYKLSIKITELYPNDVNDSIRPRVINIPLCPNYILSLRTKMSSYSECFEMPPLSHIVSIHSKNKVYGNLNCKWHAYYLDDNVKKLWYRRSLEKLTKMMEMVTWDRLYS